MMIEFFVPMKKIPTTTHQQKKVAVVNGKPKFYDTDNLQKLLKDCMTDLEYWKDDAQVASEIVEKFWSDTVGIYVKVEEL